MDTLRAWAWVGLLVIVAGCGGDSGADNGLDAAALGDAETCEAGPAFCDGDHLVACVNGLVVRTPCQQGTYCSHGECVATTIDMARDTGFHEYRTEWWYYTGHLHDGDQQWGFQVTIFQYDFTELLDIEGLGYMCHVAVIDKNAGEHHHYDAIILEKKEWTDSPIVLDIDKCRFEMGGDGRDRIIGEIPVGREKDGKPSPWKIDLNVEPLKRVVHHGADGIIPMSLGGGTSWYYSYTRLAASGTLTTPDGDRQVEGQAWMDHQWGDFDMVEFKGWDWWSLQFEDGWEIMLFQFTDWDGNLALKAGTIVDPGGNLTALEGMDAFTITPLRTWPSPHNDGVYPLDWDIEIPVGDWNLQVRTAVDDCEMHNIAQNYWEGDTTVTGTRDGQALTGIGFTELTGYATDFMDPD